jgi:chorismate mutase
MELDMITIPEALEIKLHKFQGSKVRRHPVLPVRKFEKSGHEIDVTEDMLKSMINNLTIKRPVTIAHPELSGAEAVGWIMPGTAEISAFGDGGKALYVGIEWSEQAEQAIKDKKYGYISPVFAPSKLDEAGNEIGAALVAAGLTNDPHWSSDQPELWAQFCSSIDTTSDVASQEVAETASAETAFVNNDERIDEMKELEKAEAKIKELDKALAEMTSERDKAAADLAKAKEQVESFSAESSKTERLEAEVRQMRGMARLKEHEAVLRPKHLKDEDGKPTPLYQAAFAEDGDQFEYMISLIGDAKSFNAKPVGANKDDSDDGAVRERAHKRALEASVDDRKSYTSHYIKFFKEECAKEKL